jgi:hypothetical protein
MRGTMRDGPGRSAGGTATGLSHSQAPDLTSRHSRNQRSNRLPRLTDVTIHDPRELVVAQRTSAK